MKISNLFESMGITDFSTEALTFKSSKNDLAYLSKHYKIGDMATNNTVVNGWVYYFLMLCYVITKTDNTWSATNPPAVVTHLKINDHLTVCTAETLGLYTPMYTFFKAFHDAILLNALSSRKHALSAEQLYQQMLDEPVIDDNTLEDISYELKDQASILAKALAHKGFSEKQLWGEYSVSKFERVFLTFVRNRINESVA